MDYPSDTDTSLAMANTGNPSQESASPPIPAAYSRHISYEASNDHWPIPDVYTNEKASSNQATRPTDPPTPLPAAYTRQLSYGLSNVPCYDANVYVKEYESSESATSPSTNVDSLEKSNSREEDDASTGKRQKSVLLFLRDSRFYIRVVAVLIMVVSLSLILTAIISFSEAQKTAGNPLNNVPKPGPITDHPCVVFSGVAAMNLVFSISLLCVSCISSKFRKSREALNAAFTIISAIGFASSMSACFFLNKHTTLENDLWKWSCGNHKKGIVSDAIDFNLICNVVSYGWKFGLVQASLELLTFLISVTAFVLMKYSYLVRYGRVGKVF